MDKNKIKQRLQSLLARARDAGSSETEVAACMAKARNLMDEYGYSEADLDDVGKQDFRKYECPVKAGRKKHSPVLRYCGPTIAKFCGVKSWLEAAADPKKPNIVFFGLDADVELATWMVASLSLFMEDQWDTYKRFKKFSSDELVAEKVGFIRGFCYGIVKRLHQMVDNDVSETSTALVVKKTVVVDRELESRGIRLRKEAVNLSGSGKASNNAMRAGHTASQGADLGRGVGAGRIALGKL